ncbi:MAG: 2-oxoglutarate dehydrogenase E1 component, partial [Bacteroidetes bacterium]
AIVHHAVTSEPYSMLDNIAPEQEKLHIYNSLLSEYGVLGFEFGYAMANPHALVIWEAQFGDFANGAQIMIDQFISSSESKWQRMTGLVLQLPHGYEGQGPEHSSARPERFLQMCAENNMVVVNVTTPANFFHLLRRQLVWNFRKPCIVMSPKSLLRHPKCVSPLEDFKTGGFKEVIEDNFVDPKKVKRVVLCTGKIYYELLEKQQAEGRKDVAIIRLEQLYPYPKKQLEAAVKSFEKYDLLWVQEEPKNMGYWGYMLRVFSENNDYKINVVSRKATASPATGYSKVHAAEQAEIINKAFDI